MGSQSASMLRPVLRDVTRFDRSRLSLITAAWNAVGVAVPLAVGAAAGHLDIGLSVSVGALNAAYSDLPDPYPRRAAGMLLTGVCGAVSVFVGSATGGVGWLAVLVALGPVATQAGLTSMLLLLVYGYGIIRPDPARALGVALLVLAGAVLQLALSVAAWPVRPYGPEREALAGAYRALAAYARRRA